MYDSTIRSMYPTVVTINKDGDLYEAFDQTYNAVPIDLAAIEAAWATGANDRAFAELRTKRDSLLHDTDWWASSDLSISESQTTYRQSLRDLPANTPDPANPTWPVAPGV